ncbi:helical hairpin domain-containing protein [Lactococcus lactis]|nr:helical hairpin domain-containing protein [Lactococcus lactis]
MQNIGYNSHYHSIFTTKQVPLKKEPVISTINELVDAINFLAEHGVTEGTQFNNMESQLMSALGDAEEKLSIIDSRIMELTKISKLLIEVESGYSQTTLEELEKLGVNPKINLNKRLMGLILSMKLKLLNLKKVKMLLKEKEYKILR